MSRNPAAPASSAAQDQLVGVERRQHDHRRRVRLGAHQPGRGDAVEPRHADVHQHDVGPVAVDRGQHLVAVGRLADHLESAAPASISRSPERTSASSSTSRTRIRGPRQASRAARSAPSGVGAVLAARRRPARRARRARPARFPRPAARRGDADRARLTTSTTSGASGARDRRPRRAARRRVLARVGQALPGRCGRRCARQRRDACAAHVACERDGDPGRARLLDQRRELAPASAAAARSRRRRPRAAGRSPRAAPRAPHARSSRITPAAVADSSAGASAVLQRARVHAEHRQPVGEHVVHLARRSAAARPRAPLRGALAQPAQR